MSLYLYVAETVDSIRAKIIGYAQTANLKITNWIAGGVGSQILETVANTVQGVTTIQAKAIRGFASLDTSVDPGDADPYDPTNIDLAPAPGYLSDLGSNFYGTDRIGATEATGAIDFLNTGVGAVNQSLPAFSVTFQRDYADANGFQPTYRNSAPIVCGAGISLTAALGNPVPIVCETAGTSGNSSATHVTILVTTLPGVTVINQGAVLGTDRQGADAYRTTCREAAALTSPNGPADAYRYLITTARDDGTFGQSTTGNPLGLTRSYVSQASATGIVNVYYAGPTGGTPVSGFLSIVTALIKTTPGVIACPQAITISVNFAIDVSIALSYSASIKASNVPGGASAGTYFSASLNPAPIAAIFTAIATAEDAYLAGVDIGGNDQVAGAGVIYPGDLEDAISTAQINNATLKLYNVNLATPASPVALAIGHDGVRGSTGGTLLVT